VPSPLLLATEWRRLATVPSVTAEDLEASLADLDDITITIESIAG
jgi:hypothetical protein